LDGEEAMKNPGGFELGGERIRLEWAKNEGRKTNDGRTSIILYNFCCWFISIRS